VKPNLKALLGVAAAISREPCRALSPRITQRAGIFHEALAEVLSEKNGFYAFESALHVFFDSKTEVPGSLRWWNRPEGWQDSYAGIWTPSLCFAEDIFGNQFLIADEAVQLFDPETACAQPFADSLDEWAEKILDDVNVTAGYPLAHEWQVLNGVLPIGCRLVPRVPFVLGGEFGVHNMFLIESEKGMRYRADIARQIRTLKPGDSVRLEVVE
jgi:hypothetical protein